jgi:hypothetical protein
MAADLKGGNMVNMDDKSWWERWTAKRCWAKHNASFTADMEMTDKFTLVMIQCPKCKATRGVYRVHV